jgi:indole-3-glycerol phosphate synthase
MDPFEGIRAAKRAESDQEKRALPMRRAIELASAAQPPHPFVAALRRPGSAAFIAEIPAVGSKAAGGLPGGPAAAARVLSAAGATALSVITDARFLHGSPAHVAEVRAAVGIPILRKDFIIDEYGVYRSRALQADAILLMAGLVEERLLRTLVGVSLSLHMDALVEVQDPEDVRRALESGAEAIMVNNRDRTTGAVSLETSLRLGSLLPESIVKVSTRGIETDSDVARLRAAGFDAVLVGERLTRDGDPGEALRRLAGGSAA